MDNVKDAEEALAEAEAEYKDEYSDFMSQLRTRTLSMDDLEEVVEGEALAEAEAEFEDEYTDSRSPFRALVLSIARQFFCSCSVMMFPVLSLIYRTIKTELNIVNLSGSEVDIKNRNALIALEGDIMITAMIGFIIGGLLLRFMGRKYTIVLTNFLHVVLLSYTLSFGVQEHYPYHLSLANAFVREIGYMSFFIYLAEITSPKFRAFFMGFYVLNETIAKKIVFIAQDGRKVYEMFRDVTVITSLSFLLAIFTPETPFWLTLKGNPEKAEEIFTWIRAGYSDMDEFNQMLSTVEDYSGDKRILKRILSRTFIMGFIFSILVSIGTFNPGALMDVVLHDYYSKSDEPTENEKFEIDKINAQTFGNKYLIQDKINAVLIFLILNFVVPRKLLYFMSYSFGLLIIVVIRFKLGTLETLIHFSSYSLSTTSLGTAPLQNILAVEMYPTTLREIGLVATSVFRALHLHACNYFSHQPERWFPVQWISRSMNYITLYISLIGIPFLLIFMPETKNTNIYLLDQVKSGLYSVSRKDSPSVEAESEPRKDSPSVEAESEPRKDSSSGEAEIQPRKYSP
ncbi:hypothetical protein V9T40_011559 [Parthenolecanium corni]|uniref:Uncharacterized protein n=1 Tax=Parthenolecanium corni TaxID=536013 RepID=A0AAN9T9K5_9HEMI